MKISNDFTHFIFDIWGVLHDGSKPYPGIHDCLTLLKKRNKFIALITNTPDRQKTVESKLKQMGFNCDFFHCILTAGDVATTFMENNPTYKNLSLAYIVGSFQLLSKRYQSTEQLESAQFIIIADMPTHSQDKIIDHIVKNNIPVICINPDKVTVTQENKIHPEAGTFAQILIENDVVVDFVGKPYLPIYENACLSFGNVNKENILAIGDNIETDIVGANHFGITSVLKLGGVSSQLHCSILRSHFEGYNDNLKPNYIVSDL